MIKQIKSMTNTGNMTRCIQVIGSYYKFVQKIGLHTTQKFKLWHTFWKLVCDCFLIETKPGSHAEKWVREGGTSNRMDEGKVSNQKDAGKGCKLTMQSTRNAKNGYDQGPWHGGRSLIMESLVNGKDTGEIMLLTGITCAQQSVEAEHPGGHFAFVLSSLFPRPGPAAQVRKWIL